MLDPAWPLLVLLGPTWPHLPRFALLGSTWPLIITQRVFCIQNEQTKEFPLQDDIHTFFLVSKAAEK